MVQHTIHQSTRIVAVARMHDHVHGFVQHQHLIVLMNDVQIHGLGQELKLKYGLWQLHRDHIPRLDLVVALDRHAIHPNVSGFRGGLQLVSGQMRHQVDDEFVHAKRGLPCIRGQSMMLEQLFTRVVILVLKEIHGLEIQGLHHNVVSAVRPSNQ